MELVLLYGLMYLYISSLRYQNKRIEKDLFLSNLASKNASKLDSYNDTSIDRSYNALI